MLALSALIDSIDGLAVARRVRDLVPSSLGAAGKKAVHDQDRQTKRVGRLRKSVLPIPVRRGPGSSPGRSHPP
jgi:hypothetical protein